MKNRNASFLTFLLILAFPLFFLWGLQSNILSTPSSTTTTTKWVLVNTITKEKVIYLTNMERINEKLPVLTENLLLDKSAELKACDMRDNNYFAHTSPSGVSPWDWFTEVGYSYRYAEENLAEGYYTSESVVSAWMASTGHRKNILATTVDEMGVGVCGDYTAQHFGSRL